MVILKNLRKVLIHFLICTIACACYSQALQVQDDLVSPEDGPVLVLSRESAFFGVLQKYSVLINDKKISEISNNSYLKIKLKPGKYKIAVSPGGVAVVASINVEIKDQDVYLEYVYPVGVLVNYYYIGSKIERKSKSEILGIMNAAQPMGNGDLIDLTKNLMGTQIVEASTLQAIFGGVHSSSKYPASGFAPIEDIQAVPLINSEGCRKNYETWLAQKYPKAFAVGVKKGCAYAQGNQPHSLGDSRIPAERVMSICERVNGACQLYAVDDRVVFTSSTEGSLLKINKVQEVEDLKKIHAMDKYPSSGFAEINDVSAVPLVNSELCRKKYENWLQQKFPKAFAVGQNKGCGFIWGIEPRTPGDSTVPAERVISVCERVSGNGKCVLYAVDDRVVYIKPD